MPEFWTTTLTETACFFQDLALENLPKTSETPLQTIVPGDPGNI
jgi:hypothetical protein